MSNDMAALTRRAVQIFVSLLPWSASLYLHYVLEHKGIWAVDAPFRALFSVCIIAAGMGLSFYVHGRITRRRT